MSDPTRSDHIYDPFTGPKMNADKWQHLTYPLPDGPWKCAEPSARVDVGDGHFAVEIDTFERSHPAQMVDNCKFVVLSTQDFFVPSTGTLSVTCELAAVSVADTGDYRDGFASLIAIDPSTGWVYDIAANSHEVLAIHERLPIDESTAGFTRIIDTPLSGLSAGPDVPHSCRIVLDAGNRRAEWYVDDKLVFDARDIDIPQQIHVGMGIFTLHSVDAGASRSLRGQGLHGRWSNLAVQIDG